MQIATYFACIAYQDVKLMCVKISFFFPHPTWIIHEIFPKFIILHFFSVNSNQNNTFIIGLSDIKYILDKYIYISIHLVWSTSVIISVYYLCISLYILYP